MTGNNDWIKARASSGGGDCVEMRQAGTTVQVRDSKLGSNSPVHVMSNSGFAIWLKAAQNGELDQLSS